MDNIQHADRDWRGGRVFGGIVVIIVGVSMLIDRTGWFDVRVSSHYWPVILIALGVMKLLDPRHRDRRPRPVIAGAWLVYLGCWGLVNEFHLFGFDYHSSWPLLIVGAGVGIVWRAFRDPRDENGPIRER
jgi:hypothetical protein